MFLFPLSFRVRFPVTSYRAIVCEQPKLGLSFLSFLPDAAAVPSSLAQPLRPQRSALAPGRATALTFFISPFLELSLHKALRAYNAIVERRQVFVNDIAVNAR